MIIVKILLGVLTVCVLVLAAAMAVEAGKSRKIRANYPRTGKMIEIHKGCRMNVYGTGEGERTFVMLSGWGTPAPAVDFTPMINAMEGMGRIAVPEVPGYGASDDTLLPRRTEYIVEEIRTALREAGFQPPYYLMPHSMSGMHTLCWAKKYPEEVAGIIGIDISFPLRRGEKLKRNRKVKFKRWFCTKTGLFRRIVHTGKLDKRILDQCGQDESLFPYMKELTACRAMDSAVYQEGLRFRRNVAYIRNCLPDPKLPLLLFSSTIQAEQAKTRGLNWQEGDRKLAECSERAKIVIYEAPHYLHHEKAAEMAAEIRDFFSAGDARKRPAE